MVKGYAAKPTKLKLIEGTRSHRINRHEPAARPVLPECPEGVSDAVREIWDYTLRELETMEIAAAADRDTLLSYCEAVVTHRRASAMLAQSGLVIKNAFGALVRNPAVVMQRDAANTVRMFAQEFGLTPSARSRIDTRKVNAADDDTENPFAGTG